MASARACCGLASVLVCLLTTVATANAPPPPLAPQDGAEAPAVDAKPKDGSVPLVIKRNARAEVARIQIPAKFLPAGGEKEKKVSAIETRTMFAGIALSLAVASVFFVRRSGRTTRVAAAAVLVVAALLGVVGVAWADLIPPGRGPARPPAADRVILEIVDKGDEVVVTLPAPAANAPPRRPEPKQ